VGWGWVFLRRRGSWKVTSHFSRALPFISPKGTAPPGRPPGTCAWIDGSPPNRAIGAKPLVTPGSTTSPGTVPGVTVPGVTVPGVTVQLASHITSPGVPLASDLPRDTLTRQVFFSLPRGCPGPPPC